MARPRKQIDRGLFEKLCGIQCSLAEISDIFGVTPKTLETWCKREYKKNFSEVFREKRKIGFIALRRMQFRHAAKSPQMAIFLGKQYLGQADKITAEVIKVEDDPITKALKESNMLSE